MVAKKIAKQASKKDSSLHKVSRHRTMFPDLTFALALCAMLATDADLNKAAVWFKKLAPRPVPQHLKEFILRVWHRYQDGDIAISARATPKRSKKVPDDQALKASSLFLQGKQGLSGPRPYANAKQVRFFLFFSRPH